MEAMLNDWGIGDEGLWRHQAIIEEIKKLQKNIQTGYQKPHLSYDSVVNEFGVDLKNPLSGLFAKLFKPRRKLKPDIWKWKPVAMQNVDKAIIKVHIASGINVPIWEGSLDAILSLNEQINREYGQRSWFTTGWRQNPQWNMNPRAQSAPNFWDWERFEDRPNSGLWRPGTRDDFEWDWYDWEFDRDRYEQDDMRNQPMS